MGGAVGARRNVRPTVEATGCRRLSALLRRRYSGAQDEDPGAVEAPGSGRARWVPRDQLPEGALPLSAGARGASQADGDGRTSVAEAGRAPGGRVATLACFTGGMLFRYAAMA
jgi:hypothetical protein